MLSNPSRFCCSRFCPAIFISDPHSRPHARKNISLAERFSPEPQHRYTALLVSNWSSELQKCKRTNIWAFICSLLSHISVCLFLFFSFQVDRGVSGGHDSLTNVDPNSLLELVGFIIFFPSPQHKLRNTAWAQKTPVKILKRVWNEGRVISNLAKGRDFQLFPFWSFSQQRCEISEVVH